MDTKKLPTAPSVPANLLKVLPEQRSTVVENDCAWFIYDPHAGFLNKGKAQFGVLAREDVGIEPTDGFDWTMYLVFWDLIAALVGRGTGVLMISHLLHDRDRFDRIYDLRDGRLCA